MKTTWKDVETGVDIVAGGKRWTVVKVSKTDEKKLLRVKLKGPGGVFTRDVKRKGEVEVVEEAVVRQVRRGGMEPERGHTSFKAAQERTAAARRDPWKVDPADTLGARIEGRRNATKGGGGPWDKAADKAEKAVRKVLKGELLGVQVSEGAPYSVPTIGQMDATTIKAHLWAFHQLEAKSLGYDDLVKAHHADHLRADTDPNYSLFVEHHHAQERPA